MTLRRGLHISLDQMAVARNKAELLEKLAARAGLTEEERAVLREAAAALREGPSASDAPSPAAERRPRAKQRQRRSAAQKPASADASQFEAIVWTDGAARGNPGPAGIGAILQTVSGETLARCSEYFGYATNNVAEYGALLMGLRRALELGLRRIEVRADSELLIKQLRGEYRVKNAKLKPMFEQAKHLLAQFECSSLRHVPRELNAEADRLANEGIDTA